MFFVEKTPAKEVADKFNYTYRAFTSITSNFRKNLKQKKVKEPFFISKKKGRKKLDSIKKTTQIIVNLRKKNYSRDDIKVALDGMGYKVSEKTIWNILHQEGFSRLPRRNKLNRNNLETVKIKAQKSEILPFRNEKFKTNSGGILCLLPFLAKYKLDQIIKNSDYPETKAIGRLNSILSFLALKLSGIHRYSADDLWCMDRGLGLFAGLNVLPKAAWFTSYSHRVTSDMNLSFLKKLHQVWLENDLLHDTANLDFTTIPYWGDDAHLENNWSGKRNKALSSILAVLAQDPDSGIIDYGHTDVRHKNESGVVLEYLDFYQTGGSKRDLKYLVFDSKFTNYENLAKLDDDHIKFITIRRRGKNIVESINKIPKEDWKIIRVDANGNKKRTLRICDQRITLNGYLNKDGTRKEIRQIVITGHGKIKPALIITNDFDIAVEKVVRKYARRWLVEKVISEQIQFFHLNKVSSSMVIKVDFDLTMTILAHNLYRLLASELGRYSHFTSLRLFEKFILNGGFVDVEGDTITVRLKKKRDLPLMLEILKDFQDQKYEWLHHKKIVFEGASTS